MKPIKFDPILKQTLWGGEKIAVFKRLGASQERTGASQGAGDGVSNDRIGESWEISGVENNESIIADGELKGKTLTEAVTELKDKLVGVDNYKRFGNDFPLLIKFIDARQDLSIQVHPNDEMARRNGMKNGKTEMWYIMDSDPKAKLFNGLKRDITPEEYTKMVENDTICDALAEYSVKSGDCFFIPAGRVHSIGAGCFLAEIQQTSDATYRIYDFKRKDKNGNYRELHTKQAADCIDYNVEQDYQTDYVPVVNQGVSLVRCAYFNTAVYELDEPMTLDYSELDSFVIFIGIKGEGVFVDNEGNETTLREGETILVPATTDTLYVTGTIKFLETYV
ncbi:MAG: class I mannose-6-phosphate isomerase [Prevotellaceae bacterium]|nr:class I mannose-6-phosphate isomerase [Prevotellaceae bacterium]